MIDVTTSVEIERPVPEVFAFVADLTNAPQWQSDLYEVRRLKSLLGARRPFGTNINTGLVTSAS